MEDKNIYDDELYHYGRLGMKWGQHIFGKVKAKKVAKQRKESLEKARKARTEKRQAEAERQKKLASGKLSVKEMTDAELQQKINRLNLERTYKSLEKEAKMANSTSNRGKRFVNRFIDSSLDKIADNVAADLTAQATKVLLTKAINSALGEEGVYTNNKRK